MEIIKIQPLTDLELKLKTTEEIQKLFQTEYETYSEVNKFLVDKIEENLSRRNNISVIEAELLVRGIKIKVSE